MSKSRIAALLLSTLALLVTAAVATRRGPDAAPTGTAPAGAPQAQIVTEGDVVPMEFEEMDPQTREALRHDSEGLVQVYHPDGSVSMNLEGRYQTTALVRIGPDGRPVVSCVETAEPAAAPAPAPEVK